VCRWRHGAHEVFCTPGGGQFGAVEAFAQVQDAFWLPQPTPAARRAGAADDDHRLLALPRA
jgi:hypothetical protein